MASVSLRRPRIPVPPEMRQSILVATREQVETAGVAATTVRDIAGRAGVAPAQIQQYFGSRTELVLTALDLPLDPWKVVGPAVRGGVEGAGERLVRAFVAMWDDPAVRPAVTRVLTQLLDAQGELLFDGLINLVFGPVVRRLHVDQPRKRMTLIASQMFGMLMFRYAMRIRPVSTMTVDELVAAYGPTIQRYLTGEIDPVTGAERGMTGPAAVAAACVADAGARGVVTAPGRAAHAAGGTAARVAGSTAARAAGSRVGGKGAKR